MVAAFRSATSLRGPAIPYLSRTTYNCMTKTRVVNLAKMSRKTASLLSGRGRMLTVSSSRLFSNVGSSSESLESDNSGDSRLLEQRIEALHKHLELLGIAAEDLAEAAMRSLVSTEGYDPRFGKSAIRAYRAHVNSKHVNDDVSVAGSRCARQIDFLAKRHRSQEAEWVRHLDDAQAVRQEFPLTLVLDNLRSAFNVGSIFRTADACGVNLIITTGLTPHPSGSGAEKLAKSALGAERVVPTKHFDTTLQAIQFLRSNNSQQAKYLLVGMETTKRSVCYTDLTYPGHFPTKDDMMVDSASEYRGTALILGNEVSGVDTDIMPLLDEIVEIPMFGAKNSLNVAACAPVVMYEILRQWGVKSRPPTPRLPNNSQQ
eukprot:scaffold14371_cov40-Attheya_sp.AAC.9